MDGLTPSHALLFGRAPVPLDALRQPKQRMIQRLECSETAWSPDKKKGSVSLYHYCIFFGCERGKSEQRQRKLFFNSSIIPNSATGVNCESAEKKCKCVQYANALYGQKTLPEDEWLFFRSMASLGDGGSIAITGHPRAIHSIHRNQKKLLTESRASCIICVVPESGQCVSGGV